MRTAFLSRAAIAVACIVFPMTAFAEDLNELIAQHAEMNEVPEALVHRVVKRESNYNPRAVGRGGAMGLMQIKTATARALGYKGSAAGLLQAETNLTYGVRYLAGAYRVADGNEQRTISYYANGYYYAAKKRVKMHKPVEEPEKTEESAPGSL